MSTRLPPALQKAVRAAADAEVRVSAQSDALGEASRRAAEKRGELAEHIKATAHDLGISARSVCIEVARRMKLSVSTVKGGLYEYPYRADVLTMCVDVLSERAQARNRADRVAA